MDKLCVRIALKKSAGDLIMKGQKEVMDYGYWFSAEMDIKHG